MNNLKAESETYDVSNFTIRDVTECGRAVRTMGIGASSMEGVTVEQMNFLKEQSCGEMQGYFFSKPIEPEKYADLLEKYDSLDQ